jgi:hypothetical protein
VGSAVVSEIDQSDRGDSRSQGPPVRITGDREREAADAVRPIFELAVKELGLSPEGAEALMLRVAETYVRCRSDGAEVFAQQVNRALSAEDIPIVVVFRHGSAHLSDGGEDGEGRS